jgi:hypothetical protein
MVFKSIGFMPIKNLFCHECTNTYVLLFYKNDLKFVAHNTFLEFKKILTPNRRFNVPSFNYFLD